MGKYKCASDSLRAGQLDRLIAKINDHNPKKIICRSCGGNPVLRGQDHKNTEGPYYIMCKDCGIETDAWAYPREAWKQWNFDNPT